MSWKNKQLLCPASTKLPNKKTINKASEIDLRKSTWISLSEFTPKFRTLYETAFNQIQAGLIFRRLVFLRYNITNTRQFKWVFSYLRGIPAKTFCIRKMSVQHSWLPIMQILLEILAKKHSKLLRQSIYNNFK